MKIKSLALVLSMVFVITALILGTTAYLTDTAGVINTFTVGDVTIHLDEAKVDENGVPIPGAQRVAGNSYHLIPGRSYTKDPTVTVQAESVESYVRMVVTISCYKELCAIFGDPFLPQNFVSGWDPDLWVTTGEIVVDEVANTGSYEFRYCAPVAGGAEGVTLDALFDTITVPETMTGTQLKTIAELQIHIEAHAIQKSGFQTADAAWAAFLK